MALWSCRTTENNATNTQSLLLEHRKNFISPPSMFTWILYATPPYMLMIYEERQQFSKYKFSYSTLLRSLPISSLEMPLLWFLPFFMFAFGIFAILRVCMCIQLDRKVFHYTFQRFMPNIVALAKQSKKSPFKRL